MRSLLALLFVVASAGAASANSSHMAPEKITRTARGCSITFCVRPAGHGVVRAIIGDHKGNSFNNTNYTGRVVAKPYALFRGPTTAVTGTGPLTIEVPYDGGKLKSGETVDLVTAWNRGQPAGDEAPAEHVWGMSRGSAAGIQITLP